MPNNTTGKKRGPSSLYAPTFLLRRHASYTFTFQIIIRACLPFQIVSVSRVADSAAACHSFKLHCGRSVRSRYGKPLP